MAGLDLGRKRRGCPRAPLLLPTPLPQPQPFSHCSPSKGHQGHSGVGGPGQHEEKDDQQHNLGHFPLALQPLLLPGQLTEALTGPKSLKSPRKGAESGSEPTRVAVSARVMAAVGEPPWTWLPLPVQADLTPRKFSITSSLSFLPGVPPAVSSLPPHPGPLTCLKASS